MILQLSSGGGAMDDGYGYFSVLTAKLHPSQ